MMSSQNPSVDLLILHSQGMPLTTEHLLPTDSWKGVLQKFGDRYGVMKVFIDEFGEEDNFSFDDHIFEAKAFSQQGLNFIKTTLESLDTELNLDFELVDTTADSDLQIHFANSPSNSWAYGTIGYSSIGDDIQWTENIIVLDADWWYASSDQAAASDTWEHSVPFLHYLGAHLGLEYVNNANDGDSFGDNQLPTTETSLMAWGMPEQGFTQTQFQAIDIEALQAIWGVEDNSDNYDTGDLEIKIDPNPVQNIILTREDELTFDLVAPDVYTDHEAGTSVGTLSTGLILKSMITEDDPDGYSGFPQGSSPIFGDWRWSWRTPRTRDKQYRWEASFDDGEQWQQIGATQHLRLQPWHQNAQLRITTSYHDGKGFKEIIASDATTKINTIDLGDTPKGWEPYLLPSEEIREVFNFYTVNEGKINVWVDIDGESTELWGGIESITAKPVLEENQNVVQTIIKQLNDLLDIEFALVDTPEGVTLRLIGETMEDTDGWSQGFYNYSYTTDGDGTLTGVEIPYMDVSMTVFEDGLFDYHTLLHEIGHALGLAHPMEPHNGSKGSGDIFYPTHVESVMAYEKGLYDHLKQDIWYTDSDINALQALWGDSNGEFPIFAAGDEIEPSEDHDYALISGNGDADNSLFEIQGDQLLLLETPENSDRSSYSIRLRSIDPDGNAIEQSFEINAYQHSEQNAHTHDDDVHHEEDVDTSEAIEDVDDTNNQIEDIDHHDDDHSDTSRPTDVDGDGAFQPLRDGLLISSAGQAIEIAAGTESQPSSFKSNLHDQLINPDGSRNTTDAAKAFIKDAITSGSLDRNNNNVLDLQDAQRILRDGLGTYPGDAATAGLREPPVPAGTTNSDLINEQEQLDALDDSLEAIALMAEGGAQFLNARTGRS